MTLDDLTLKYGAILGHRSGCYRRVYLTKKFAIKVDIKGEDCAREARVWERASAKGRKRLAPIVESGTLTSGAGYVVMPRAEVVADVPPWVKLGRTLVPCADGSKVQVGDLYYGNLARLEDGRVVAIDYGNSYSFTHGGIA